MSPKESATLPAQGKKEQVWKDAKQGTSAKNAHNLSVYRLDALALLSLAPDEALTYRLDCP